MFRYIDANIRACDKFRRYDESIPRYIRNKPPKVAKHLFEKFGMAKDFSINNLRTIVILWRVLTRRIKSIRLFLILEMGYHLVSVRIGKGQCYHANI